MDKVCIIANGFQEHYILCVVNAFAKIGKQVDFIGSDIYKDYRIHENVTFLNLRGSHDENVPVMQKNKRLLAYYLRLARYYKKSSVKVVHVQWYRFPFAETIYLKLLAFLFRKKNVYTVHDVYPHSKETVVNKITFWIIYRLHSHLIAHTNFIKQRLINEFGVKPHNVTVIRHGLYDQIVESKEQDVVPVKTDEIKILFFGYIAYYKGLHLLMEAFSKMKDVPNLKLAVGGRVEDAYKEEFDRLREKYSDSRITYKLGYLPDQDVHNLLTDASVIVLPYLEASQSGVLLMAYTYSKPVIVSRLGGFPDDVENGKTGFLFEPNNAQSLENALRDFVNAWNNGEIHFEYIQKYSKENYSWAKSAHELLVAYGAK